MMCSHGSVDSDIGALRMRETEQTMLAECLGLLLNVPTDKPKPRQET